MNPKVLMFGWEFPPYNSGGLGTACLGLTRALARKNIQVLFVLPKKVNVSSSFAKILFADEKNIHVEDVDVFLYPYATAASYGKEIINGIEVPIRHHLSLMDEVKRYGLKARAIAKKEQFDVIHAHDWLSFLAGVEAKKVSGKPLILHMHATEFDRTGGQGANEEVYKIEREAMQYADKVIAVSEFTKQKIAAYYGIPQNKIDVVHNGIDEEDWINNSIDHTLAELKKTGKKVVLFVGRITIQKGPEYFIRAAKRVLEYDQNVVFIVSGSGDMQNQMMKEVGYLGISDKVLFPGFLRGEELKAVYRAADLYVMPSVSEPFGITPLESMMSGTPVLISRQSGVSEVLRHSLKADFWDTEDMANKILSIVAYPSLKETLQENGGKEVRSITWAKAAEKCISIYKNLLVFA